MEHLFDYAGIYPPAALSLEAALAQFRARQKSSEAWLQQRFAIGASRLDELSALLTPNDAFELAVVGPATTDRPSWESALAACAKKEEAPAPAPKVEDSLLATYVAGEFHDGSVAVEEFHGDFVAARDSHYPV